MMRLLMALFFVIYPLAVSAAEPPAKSAVTQKPTIAADTPIRSELDKLFGNLALQLKEADALVSRLRDAAAKKPDDTMKEVYAAANTLSALADRLQPNGQLAEQLLALRNAAVVHRKRVQEMDKDSIEEQDRTSILTAWTSIIQEADKGAAALGDMHDKLLGTLKKLHMRQSAVSELYLAGQYQTALDAVKAWLKDLETTVNGLHRVIDPMVGKPVA